MPRRMSVVCRCRWMDELAAEVVITATRLVPIACRMGIPKCRARIGVRRTPPPMPVSAPSMPAKKPSRTRSALSIVGLSYHARNRCRLGLFVRMIAGTDHGARLDVTETEAKRFIAEIAELLRCVETGNRQVVARRPQILAHRENIDAAGAEIAEDFDHILARLAQSPTNHAFCA